MNTASYETYSSRVWFITGTSTGFGRVLAEAVLTHGDRLLATARQTEALNDITSRYPPEQVRVVPLDVTKQTQVQTAIEAALTTFGRIDVVVNNAGYGVLGAIEEVSDAQMRAQFETNVFGVLNVVRAVLPHLRRQRSGHILNISSVGGQVASAGLGAYQASKFALEAISEALAQEVAPLGIKVTIIELGAFRTDWAGRSMIKAQSIEEYTSTAGQTREWIASLSGKQPGDPIRAAQAMIAIVEAVKPPLRLPLGVDALNAITRKLTAELQEFAQWESITTATSFSSETQEKALH